MFIRNVLDDKCFCSNGLKPITLSPGKVTQTATIVSHKPFFIKFTVLSGSVSLRVFNPYWTLKDNELIYGPFDPGFVKRILPEGLYEVSLVCGIVGRRGYNNDCQASVIILPIEEDIEIFYPTTKSSRL